MHQIEKEFKNLLTENEYMRLFEQYKSIFGQMKKQTNCYFDYQGQLHNAHCALRIRLIEGAQHGELTLKIPHTPNELREYTQTLPIATLTKWIHAKRIILPLAFRQVLKPLGVTTQHVNLTAQLSTERFEGMIAPDILFVLDKSHYGTITDYELEMEVTDLVSGGAFFQSFLQEHQIEQRPTKNKIERALAATSY